MNMFLVAFELNPGGNAPQVQQFIDGFDAMRFSDTAYALRTELSAGELFERLQPLLGTDDLAYVVTLAAPWMGYGYEAMNDWLKRQLG